MAVYVFERTPGALYHRPFYGGGHLAHETHCGLQAGTITAMSENWAQHTGLQPCSVCYAERLRAPGAHTPLSRERAT